MNWLTGLAAKILIGALMAGAVFTGGFVSGKKAGQKQQLADTVQAYERRENINANVQNATRYELCISLGGMPDECAKLRGLDAAPVDK